VSRWLAATLVLASAAAHADPKPDPRAVEAADGANLESTAPRAGLTFAGALGGSLFVGSAGGVGRGGAISLRLGHVATSTTILTFELAGGTFFHATGDKTMRDDDANILAGAQRYTNASLWIRAAAGFGVYTHRRAAMADQTLPGPAGAVGVGIDLVRRRYLVLGFEVFGIGKIHRDGLLVTSGICLGLSYY
jgi:hypothetical protein